VANPKKPPSLKSISGTDQPCRRGENDPPPPDFEPVRAFPVPPQHLNVDGAAMWSELGPQLVACGVLQLPDLFALEQVCVAWQQFRKKAKADMEITASEHNALRGLLSEFGLSPAARRRVVANITDAPPQNRFASHGRKPG
jgi:phage terminase small subunit